jgi:acyl-CoA synthetase (AMP-forming)/AMP-acid ligase II
MTPAGATSDLPTTICGLVPRAAERFGDVEALVDDGRRMTYRDLAGEVDTTARALVASGVERGDVVAIWAPNTWEWAVTALAVYTAGATLLPVNTRWKGREAGYVLTKAKAKLLFTVSDFLDIDYIALLDGVPDLEHIEQRVILRGSVPAKAIGFADFRRRADDVDPHAAQKRASEVAPSDIANVMFTSGTTGTPKGAMLRHDATVRAYDSWASVVGLREADRYLVINPFFHSFGLNAGIVASLVKGATMVPQSVFDVPLAMRRVGEEKITMFPGAPAVFQTILNHPERDQFDLSSLRLSVTGAAPITTEMILRMYDELGFETIVTGYGLTEATGIATMCRHDDPPERIAHTSGRAIPDVEVQIVDPTTKEPVPAGTEGEILVRGYNVMPGYLDDPDQTAEAIDADGWLHTGDIGVMDADGYVDITDRVKDMYITGGFNVYPAEIENVLASNPTVAQAAVIGVPDDRMGEVGKAYVVARAGESIDADELVSWCRENMANYKVPRAVEVVAELPLNATGKVDKLALRGQRQT